MKNKKIEKWLEGVVIFILNLLNLGVILIVSIYIYYLWCSAGHWCSGLIFFPVVFVPLLVIIPIYISILKSYKIYLEKYWRIIGALVINFSSVLLSMILTYISLKVDFILWYLIPFFIIIKIIMSLILKNKKIKLYN